jgi:hypothetical protein
LILVDLNFEAKLPIVTIEGNEFAGGIIHGGDALERRRRSERRDKNWIGFGFCFCVLLFKDNDDTLF